MHARLGVALFVMSTIACGGSGTPSAGDSPDASAACQAGEFRCTGDVLETCNTSGSAFSIVATCKAGLCDAAGRQCDNCKANAGDCLGSDSIKACSADGQTEATTKCAATEPFCTGAAGTAKCVACIKSNDCPSSKNDCELAACSTAGACGYAPIAKDTPCGSAGAGGKCDGAGKCTVCAPGSKVCNGAAVLTCNSSGVYDPLVKCEGATPYCDPTSPACVECSAASQCTASANPCLTATCAANKCGFAPKTVGTACPGGMCNAAGECQVCTPGTKVCNGTGGYIACNAAGKYDPPVTCASDKPYCDSTSVTCVQCTSATQCSPSGNACLTATCTANVCGFAPKASGTACSGGTCDGAGVCNSCTPGSKVCNGASGYLTCNSSGKYDPAVSCTSPTPYCDSTSVSCVQCTNATQCTAPANPCLTATCTGGACGISNRTDGAACSTGTDGGTCASGVCKVCTDGSKRCKPGATTTTQTCTGGAWVDGADCSGTTAACSSGTCVATLPSSCKAILTATPSATNGLYDIDPDGVGIGVAAVRVFCDMTAGGWTLVTNIYDSDGDDAPNATDYVVSGWQQLGSGSWATSASTVDRNSSGTGSASVSLAFVAALKANAAQSNLKMCFVHQDGTDTECRSSAAGSLTLKSYSTGNPKLSTLYSANTLVYTFGRLAGLAGSADGYTTTAYTEAGYPITKTPGTSNDYLFGGGPGGDIICDKNAAATCPAFDGVWACSGAGQSYKPWKTNAEELSAGVMSCTVVTANPTVKGYGFRLYVGP